MLWLDGGMFTMGSADFYPEERPLRRRTVDGFWIDRAPVTVEQFGRFVADTGWVTFAETAPDPAMYPHAEPQDLVPGSLVFRPTTGPVPLHDLTAWWHWVPGASWRCPEGRGSSVAGREQHPVVHVGLDDARAYAEWARKDLPTEAEWEYAARGGLEGATFSWGEDFTPDGRLMANTWHGQFPWENTAPHGFTGTSPVGAFPPNGYGLLDMTGNVWEWTADRWRDGSGPGDACCSPTQSSTVPRQVIKGGSHLCAPSYCLRYRPAARQGEPVDTTTSHLGFRCVTRDRP